MCQQLSPPAGSPVIVVAGDTCLDVLGLPIPPAQQQSIDLQENWRQTGEPRTFFRRGGSWLLADFVQGALTQAGTPHSLIQPQSKASTPIDLERLTREEIVHSLIELKVFTQQEQHESNDNCSCEVSRIRVSGTKGFSGPRKSKNSSGPTFPSLDLSLNGDCPNPTLVVMDDTGNRFRHDATLWPQAVQASGAGVTLDGANPPPLILYKLHRPMPSKPDANELWTRVAQSELIRHTIVVTNIDDIRDAGAP